MKKRMEVEQMLTTNEVAARLNITPARVRQMVTAGVIRGEKYGRDVLIPESQVAIAKTRKTTPGRPKKVGNK